MSEIWVFILSCCLLQTIPMDARTIEYIDGELQPNVSPSDNCDVSNLTMTCIQIPEKVPGFIRHVIIQNQRNPRRLRFGEGWGRIETLYIAGNPDRIKNGDLKGLDSVKEFTISFPAFVQIDSNVFVDTPNIQKLCLLDLGNLHLDTLTEALTHENVLKNLTDVSFNPGKRLNPPQVYLSNNVIDSLTDKPLSTFNFSQSLLLIGVEASVKLILNVDILNITGSSVLNIDESLLSSLNVHRDRLLLRSLDISGAVFPYRLSSQYALSNDRLLLTVLSVENVYADNVYRKDNNLTMSHDLTGRQMYLRTVMFRRNNIRIINCTYTFEEDNPLELVDLSENKIEYISPSFLSSAFNLKTLHLSNNRLHFMQYLLEFETLFVSVKSLSTLYLSANNLSYIPWTMFRTNVNLRLLNLADNQLSTVAFKLDQLTLLTKLVLSGNKIHFIEGENLARLSRFVQVRQKHGDFEVILRKNPLQCTCKSREFITWIRSLQNIDQTTKYTCDYTGSNIDINEGAIQKCQFLCNRTLIIVCSSIGSFILVLIVCATVFRARKAYRKSLIRCKVDNFIQNFNKSQLPQQFLTFVAYAGKDEETVAKTLITPLDGLLRDQFATDKRLVSTGYDFTPGFPIYDEAYRCIQNSCVFIAVVSDAFLGSDYCKGEIREAYTQQKPIIVVLLGNVTEDKMSPYVTKVFQRNARAKLVKHENGDFELIPDLSNLTKGVLTLASSIDR